MTSPVNYFDLAKGLACFWWSWLTHRPPRKAQCLTHPLRVRNGRSELERGTKKKRKDWKWHLPVTSRGCVEGNLVMAGSCHALTIYFCLLTAASAREIVCDARQLCFQVNLKNVERIIKMILLSCICSWFYETNCSFLWSPPVKLLLWWYHLPLFVHLVGVLQKDSFHLPMVIQLYTEYKR